MIQNTQRLILRQWQPSDWPLYARMNADPKVMRYLPSLLTTQESNLQAQKRQHYIEQHGWGFWAVELKTTQTFIGYVGLHRQTQHAAIPNTPFIEIGWRIDSVQWGKGYAPEAALAALHFAFNTLNEPIVYAFTNVENKASQRVMQKIGMTNTHQDFYHPKLPADHPLSHHCLYCITQQQYERLTT